HTRSYGDWSSDVCSSDLCEVDGLHPLMRNPLRSEAEAYRFLSLTIVYFAAIVLASLVGGRWWGVGVFVLLTAVGAWLFLRREETGEMTREIPARRPADQKRILVVANETVGGQTLRETIRDKAAG